MSVPLEPTATDPRAPAHQPPGRLPAARLAAFGTVLLGALAAVTWWPGQVGLPAVDLSPGAVSVAPQPVSVRPAPPVSRRADFGNVVRVSADARRVADWVATTHDNGTRDFVLVDKRAAHVYVFDRQAHLQGDAPALLGAARGDLTVPGIGDRPLAQVLPEERTTPAGRFVAEPGVNTQGEDVVWVDYDAAVSMHRVRTSNRAEHRLARLASPSIADNRISYGCINLPAHFYETQLRPRVHGGPGAVIYVLPEVLPLQQVFALAGG